MNIKGGIVPCATRRVYRKRGNSLVSGNKCRQQFVRMPDEEFVFIPARTFRTLSGESHTSPAVMRKRQVFRLINHSPRTS